MRNKIQRRQSFAELLIDAANITHGKTISNMHNRIESTKVPMTGGSVRNFRDRMQLALHDASICRDDCQHQDRTAGSPVHTGEPCEIFRRKHDPRS